MPAYIEKKKMEEPLKAKLQYFLELENVHGKKPNLTDFYDYITCMRENSKPLPIDFKHEDYADMATISLRHWFDPFLWSRDISRLGMGRLISEISRQMDKVINGESKLKLIIYSG